MRIKQDYILKAIEYINTIYFEFSKRFSSKNDLKKLISTWKAIFDEINFDYEEANNDFLKAVKLVISESKFPPTPADVSEKMKKLFLERERMNIKNAVLELQSLEKELELRTSDREKSISLYWKIRKNKSYSQIKNLMIQEKHNYLNLENKDSYEILKNIYQE